MKFNQVLLFLFLIFLSLSYSYSNSTEIFSYNFQLQDNKNLFDEEKLESFKNDGDYNYNEENSTVNWWTDFKEWLSVQWRNLFGENYNPDSFLFKILGVLPYIIIPLAFVLLIWFLVRSDPGSQIMRQHNKSKVILTEEEELLMKRDLESLAKEAISRKEYRLAIRYLYLDCIKRLDMKRIINYANEKTNYEYVREIKASEVARTFRSLTMSYEQIWYGHLIFDDTYFEKFEQNYRRFHTILDQKQYA